MAVKYNAAAYLPAAIKAARKAQQDKRPVKTAAQIAADVKTFSYDANRGWAERYHNGKKTP
jgi:hypothetical protein